MSVSWIISKRCHMAEINSLSSDKAFKMRHGKWLNKPLNIQEEIWSNERDEGDE